MREHLLVGRQGGEELVDDFGAGYVGCVEAGAVQEATLEDQHRPVLFEHVVQEDQGGAVVFTLRRGEGVVAAREPVVLQESEVFELADFAEGDERHGECLTWDRVAWLEDRSFRLGW